MTPELQMLVDGIDGCGRALLFALQLCGLLAAVGLTALFSALWLHRWLKRATWGGVIVNSERKALRNAHR